MTFTIGDRVEYTGDTVNGEYIQGQIVGIEKSSRGFITGYFAILDEKILVQFKPHNLNWHKLAEVVKD